MEELGVLFPDLSSKTRTRQNKRDGVLMFSQSVNSWIKAVGNYWNNRVIKKRGRRPTNNYTGARTNSRTLYLLAGNWKRRDSMNSTLEGLLLPSIIQKHLT